MFQLYYSHCVGIKEWFILQVSHINSDHIYFNTFRANLLNAHLSLWVKHFCRQGAYPLQYVPYLRDHFNTVLP
jgi:hypothetical protein